MTLALLARLSQTVSPRAESDAGAELQLAEYATRLRAYPADIVAATLDEWPNRSVFWPRWKELRDLLEPRLEDRLALLGLVSRLALGAPDEHAAWLADIERSDPERAAILKRAQA